MHSIKCSKISIRQVKKNNLDEKLNLYMNLTNESQLSIHNLISQLNAPNLFNSSKLISFTTFNFE